MSFVYHFHENQIKLVESSAESLDSETLKIPAGLYTTFRTYEHGTKTIGFSSHLARLDLLPGEEEVLIASIREVVKLAIAEFGELKVRITRQKGMLLDWTIQAEHFIPLNGDKKQKGVKVNLSRVRRENPTIKSTNFIQQSLEERAANQAAGIYESLIVANGLIREGFTSNFFYLIDGTLYTAKQNILKGITRASVLRLARELCVSVGYRSLGLRQLGSVTEAFICSSSRGVVPIAEMVTENLTYRWGRGEITAKLDKAYQDHESSLSELI